MSLTRTLHIRVEARSSITHRAGVQARITNHTDRRSRGYVGARFLPLFDFSMNDLQYFAKI
jgi:hypothetical protein